MKITGAHAILHTTAPDAARAVLRDVLELPHVDVGGGWLIFGLPPAEVAVHPAAAPSHELYLMCDDVETFVARVKARGVACGPVQDRGWGLVTNLELPGGGTLGVYQPRHARPKAVRVRRAAATRARKNGGRRKTVARGGKAPARGKRGRTRRR